MPSSRSKPSRDSRRNLSHAPPRGRARDKPGYYVVVSRSFVAANDDVGTVVCAPVYGRLLGLETEVQVGPDNGVPKHSAIRCDFLCLLFKSKLTGFVGSLGRAQLVELDRALAVALERDVGALTEGTSGPGASGKISRRG
ncbi:MAG: type II toxin-antitoxin system PemK/MazF family toxin [Deltaproteobacteria bacterium]|nr:type II toxin-antitoxin system PemK/MazF family toxin [Deltaproteobacteria bacterium]